MKVLDSGDWNPYSSSDMGADRGFNSSSCKFERHINGETNTHKATCVNYCSREYNKNCFGNIFLKKQRVLRRLDGLYKAISARSNPFLRQLEHTLFKEYDMLLDQEAEFWRQKSCIQWLTDGDRNTRFFHLSTIIRRRRNKIEGLFNEVNEWINTQEGLHKVVCGFFEQLYTNPTNCGLHLFTTTSFSPLSQDKVDIIGSIPDEIEVQQAIFAIGSLKAPGASGFPALFYKQYWSLCSHEVTKYVRQCFGNGVIPRDLNQTLLTLVPKQLHLTSMQQIRPLSLCETVYKVIAKILVGRLRPYLDQLIDCSQTSFVPGRHITDNIIIAQELLHFYSRTTARTGYCAWKVDLSKAYDRLSWSFLDDVLREIGITGVLHRLLMNCVTTVTYRAIVNGELTNEIVPKCGLRQGDPLSPYLFVLCLQKLSHMITDAVNGKVWKPVRASRGGPPITHLFFADDLILFFEATNQQTLIVKNCLETFCKASGQKINFAKSVLYCSPNIEVSLARDIARLSGSPLVDSLGTYLGVPLIHKGPTPQTYNYVLDNMQQRLAVWKQRTLTMAGRNFLWGDTEAGRKVHLLSWGQCTQHKNDGGLGLYCMRDHNMAILAKLPWRLTFESHSLWSQVIHAKYLKHDHILQATDRAYMSPSSTWRAILAALPILNKGRRMNGAVTIGGLLRDSKGKWMIGFHQELSQRTILEAEIQAIRSALLLINQFGYQQDCQHYLLEQPSTKLKHISRRANSAAHHIVHTATPGDDYLHVLYNPPVPLCTILNSDIAGCMN